MGFTFYSYSVLLFYFINHSPSKKLQALTNTLQFDVQVKSEECMQIFLNVIWWVIQVLSISVFINFAESDLIFLFSFSLITKNTWIRQ